MLLSDARALRDAIRETGIACTVPLGHGPDGYFARIWTCIGTTSPRDFHSSEDWQAYQEERAEYMRRREMLLRSLSRPRSPIESMIDRACGIGEGDYHA